MENCKFILVSDYSSQQGLPSYILRALNDILPDQDQISFIGEEGRTYSTDFIPRAKRKFALLSGVISHNKFSRIVNSFDSKKLNIVFLFNTSGLNIDEIKKLIVLNNVFLIHYLSDHPYGMYKQNRDVTLATVQYFNLFITMAKDLVPVLYHLGAKRVLRLPFGYCKYTHWDTTIDLPYHDNDKVYYFGTWTPGIEKWIEPLLCFNLEIKGSAWSNASDPKLRNIALNGALQMEENMAITAHKAAVVVNFTRAPHGCFHTMKTFELPASGAAVVSNRSEEQTEFFKENESYLYFNTKEEMVAKIDLLLSDNELNKKIRHKAKIAAEPHSYHERMEILISELKAIIYNGHF